MKFASRLSQTLSYSPLYCIGRAIRDTDATTLKSTEELIGEVKSGHSMAFTELVRRYERAAWVAAWKVLREYHSTNDATQNSFVEAFCKLSQLRSPSQFGVWLMRIAHREALRMARRPFRVMPLNAASEVTAPTAIDSSIEHDELITAVGNLPEHERLVVVLRYFNGHSIEEIAQLTGRPVGTVTKQLSRAIARLKSLMLVEESRK